MAKLIDVERSGGLTHKTYVHNGEDNRDKITVETSQDAQPFFDRAKKLSQNQGKDFRFKATIPGNVINDICYSTAKLWGVQPREVLQELMSGKSARGQQLVKALSEGRDYRKLQAKNY